MLQLLTVVTLAAIGVQAPARPSLTRIVPSETARDEAVDAALGRIYGDSNQVLRPGDVLTRVRPPACLPFDQPVTLAGTLKRLTFPGKPNFEDVGAGDEPETGYYLQLEAPICASGPNHDDPLREAREGVTLVQLVITNSRDLRRLQSLLDRRVSAEGLLFSSHTGHHHAPLLLEKVTLRPAR